MVRPAGQIPRTVGQGGGYITLSLDVMQNIRTEKKEKMSIKFYCVLTLLDEEPLARKASRPIYF